jgi:Protein of unknown function (DUF3866)
MVTLRRGTVTEIVERHDGLVRLEVDGRPCVAYPGLTGPVARGDDVVVNVQALDLELGSGGFDVLYVNLTRGLGLPADEGAHVMKLPYTPLQHAVSHSDENAGQALHEYLAGLPVVCCSLHSQLAPVCAGLGQDLEVAYVQLPGGALPVQLSDTVRGLRERGYLESTCAVGPCFGAEIACVSVASALVSCAGAWVDVVVCGIGPGVVGTNSRYGHGGLAAADAAIAARALGASPIIAPRVSEADPRTRHRGLSHHTRSALDLVGAPVTVAWPRGLDAPDDVEGLEVVDVSGWQEACAGLPLSHMGRGPDDDPWFFAAAFAAGALARTRMPERPV